MLTTAESRNLLRKAQNCNIRGFSAVERIEAVHCRQIRALAFVASAEAFFFVISVCANVFVMQSKLYKHDIPRPWNSSLPPLFFLLLMALCSKLALFSPCSFLPRPAVASQVARPRTAALISRAVGGGAVPVPALRGPGGGGLLLGRWMTGSATMGQEVETMDPVQRRLMFEDE